MPVVTRTTEDVLKLQPTALRESGVALGTPVWTTIRRILWRAAAGGIVTGGLLAFARISGETAPLLFTALNNQFFSWDMSRPMANLPVVIFNYALSAYDDWRRLAWVGAILIAGAVLAAQIIARILIQETRRPVGHERPHNGRIRDLPRRRAARLGEARDAQPRFFYGKTKALHGITLPVVNKNVTALIGPSGCGKSTLLRAMTASMRSIRGRRRMARSRWTARNILDPKVDLSMLRARIGMVFQKPTRSRCRSSTTWPSA